MSPKNCNPTKKCCLCGTKNTPLWRTGPLGKGSACNACGIKWTRSQKESMTKIKKKKPSGARNEKRERDPYSSGDELSSDNMWIEEEIKSDNMAPTQNDHVDSSFLSTQEDDERLVTELFYLSRVPVHI